MKRQLLSWLCCENLKIAYETPQFGIKIKKPNNYFLISNFVLYVHNLSSLVVRKSTSGRPHVLPMWGPNCVPWYCKLQKREKGRKSTWKCSLCIQLFFLGILFLKSTMIHSTDSWVLDTHHCSSSPITSSDFLPPISKIILFNIVVYKIVYNTPVGLFHSSN